MKKILFISFIIFTVCYSMAYAMKLLYYDISIPTNKKGAYIFLPNGISKFETKDFIFYLRPANKICVADGQQLWLWGSREDDKNLFISEVYYPEGSSLYKKPNYFYVEIMVYAKKDGYVFDPKKVILEYGDGKRSEVEKYIIFDCNLESIYSYGCSRLLFPNSVDEIWKTLNEHLSEKELAENRFFEIPLKKRFGFAVRFNVQLLVPGDSFNIEVDGLKHAEESIKLPVFKYSSKETYRYGAG